LSRINPYWVYEKGTTYVADPQSRCPELLHVARTQATPCAHDVINLPIMDRASRKSYGLGIQSPFMGRANSPTETTAYADVGPAFPAIVAKHLIPDGIEKLPLDIAEWYISDTETEQDICQDQLHVP